MKTAFAFSLKSKETGTTYHLSVEQPAAAHTAVPAVLFMDGDDQFVYAVDAYRNLAEQGRIPPLLLVGVGYGASYAKPANKRSRDYTPTAMAGEAGTGGADAFLSFLQNTLWPELQRRYPIDDGSRGLAGHSLGSLLALHALFQPKPFFNRLLISSPSVWFDDRSILKIAAGLRARQTLLPAQAFLSIGGQDTPSMTGDFDQLESQLAHHNFDGLKLTVRRFPENDHYDVLPVAFEQGLLALYA